MVTSGAMLKGASVHLYSPALSTSSLIHHSREIAEPPEGFRQPQFGFCKWDLQRIISAMLMKMERLLESCELWMQRTLHLQSPGRLWDSRARVVRSSNWGVGGILYRSITNHQHDIFAVFRTTCYLDNAILSFKPTATFSHSRNQMCLKRILMQVLFCFLLLVSREDRGQILTQCCTVRVLQLFIFFVL